MLLICFIAFFNAKASAQIAEGYYYIHSVSDNNYCIDLLQGVVRDGQNIQFYRSNGTEAQKWYFEPNNDGSYYIRSAKNKDYVIDVQKGVAANETNIQLYHFNGTKAQKWYLDEQSTGCFFIRSALDRNYVFDLRRGSIENGNNIQLYRYKSTKAHQKWKLYNSKTGKAASKRNSGNKQTS